MNIIKPTFSIETPFGPLTKEDGIKMLQFTETKGRISHRSEDRQTDSSWNKFLQAVVIGHGDWSITEHASLTVTIRTDRGLTHEIVRHRLFSFTQESTRFVNYLKRNTGIEAMYPEGVLESLNDSVGPVDHIDPDWIETIQKSEETYEKLIRKGWKPQAARSVLPTGLAATIAVTGNLRNWRHFLLMRTSAETHPDLRAITIPMLAKFQQNIPILYDDIIANERQANNLKKAR